MRIGALTQEYNAQYSSTVNNTIEKDNAFSSILFDKNEQSVIEAGISSQEVEITDQNYGFNNEKPTFYWHDGQFGYQAEVYKNEGIDSEYTVKLRYDDGRTEERIVDADTVDASSCNITDLSVKLYHLQNEGKIENAAPQLVLAHVYMRYRTPDATATTKIDFKGWYQQQLQLELNNNGSPKNISELMKLLNWL